MKRAIALDGVLPQPEPVTREPEPSSRYRPLLRMSDIVDVTTFASPHVQWVTSSGSFGSSSTLGGSGQTAWPSASSDGTSGLTIEWKKDP